MSDESPSAAVEEKVQTRVEDEGPCRKRLCVEVAPEAVRERIDEAYRDLVQTAAVPGFRRGRAPRTLLEKRFGKKLEEETRQTLVAETLVRVIDDKGLDVMGDSQVEKVEQEDASKPLRFEATVIVRPTFDVPPYKGLAVKKVSAQVTEEDLQHALDHLRRQKAELVPVDGASQEGDVLLCDVRLLDGETEILSREGASLKAGDEDVLGLHVPEAARRTLGVAPESTLDFRVTLPQGFKEERWRGCEVTLRVQVDDVKRVELPPADDAWARQMDFDSLQDLMAEVRRNLEADKAGEARRQMEDAAVESLVAQLPFDLPDEVVQVETRRVENRMRIRLLMAGVRDEVEIERHLEGYRSQSVEAVARGLRAYFILERIAKDERIYATEDEVEARVAAMAQRQGKWPNEMREDLEREGGIAQLRVQLREEKVRRLLLEQAQVTDGE